MWYFLLLLGSTFIIELPYNLHVCRVTYRLGSTQLNKTEQEVKLTVGLFYRHKHDIITHEKKKKQVNSQYCHNI